MEAKFGAERGLSSLARRASPMRNRIRTLLIMLGVGPLAFGSCVSEVRMAASEQTADSGNAFALGLAAGFNSHRL